MKFHGSWDIGGGQMNFKDICVHLSKNLDGFKRNGTFNGVIANDVRDIGVAKAFYNYINIHYPNMLSIDFSPNDAIGDPNLFNIGNGKYSPGTLRFMKVVGDIEKNFTDVNKIVEIGSGYGGQSFVYHMFKNPEYTCIDIPETLTLAKAYHNAVGYKDCNYLDSDNITIASYDLCISDYAVSELDADGIDFYIDNVLSKCKSAYITAGAHCKYFEHLISRLKEVFETVEYAPEDPKTTSHPNNIIYCKGGDIDGRI